MAGRVTIIKAGKLARFVAKPPAQGGEFDLPDPGNEPTAGGGRLRLTDLGDPNPADVVYDLRSARSAATARAACVRARPVNPMRTAPPTPPRASRASSAAMARSVPAAAPT
jgi:hypothetical protein